MSAQPTTHIADAIVRLRAERVEIRRKLEDHELHNQVLRAFRQLRFPDMDENPQEIHEAAKEAVIELAKRLRECRAALTLARCEARAAQDSFDDQCDEVERLRSMLR